MSLELLIFNVKVGLIAAAGVIVFFIVTSMMEKNHQLMRTRWQKRRQDLQKEVLATLQGMQVIKSHNLGGENNMDLRKSIKDTSRTLRPRKICLPYTVIQR